MGDAARTIHWNGTDIPEALRSLPPGDYHLVPAEGDDDSEVSPEVEAKIEAGIADIRAGRTVPWETVRAELAAKLASRRAR